MYVLFYDDGEELAGVFQTKSHAMTVARRLSRATSRAMTAVFNDREGNAMLCFKYELGEKTFESEICPDTASKPRAKF
jgi:hypothetical protein